MADRRLPDWNDLPDALRSGLVDAAAIYVAGSNVEDYAGDIALAIFERLACELPVPVFPLFDRGTAVAAPANGAAGE